MRNYNFSQRHMLTEVIVSETDFLYSLQLIYAWANGVSALSSAGLR